MSDPRWTDETEQLVAEALWAACFVPPRGAGTAIGQPSKTCYEDARGALAALADAGLLTPPSPSLAGSEAGARVFTFEIPTIPADITKLRDKTGRIWTAVNAGGYRTWRFMTLRFTDGTLLASIYGPTFTEVTS